MIVLQTIAVAFAMFSAIPVPQFDWNEKNMRYAMCAFPLIGVVIGAAWCVCGALPLPGFAKAAGFALIPVWITGGIHLDGYADTCDALSSYGDREKKLEILKDPHCGAFAVIRLCSYFLAYFALCTCVSFTPRVGVLWVLALVLEQMHAKGIYTYAAHLKGQEYYDSFSFREPTAFLIGNEGNGLSKEISDQAGQYLKIPMEGRVESLNASIAAALLMYEAHRQRSARL